MRGHDGTWQQQPVSVSPYAMAVKGNQPSLEPTNCRCRKGRAARTCFAGPPPFLAHRGRGERAAGASDSCFFDSAIPQKDALPARIWRRHNLGAVGKSASALRSVLSTHKFVRAVTRRSQRTGVCTSQPFNKSKGTFSLNLTYQMKR